MLSEQDIAAIVREFYNSILAQDENVRLMRDDPIPEERRANYVEHYRQLAERARIDLANSAFGSVRSITSTMIDHHFGNEAQLEKADVRRVSQAMLRAGIEVAETLKARADGDFNYEPKDKLLQAALHSPTPPMPAELKPEASPPPPPPPPPAPPAPAGPPFSQEAETFRLAQLRRKVWEQQTGLQVRKTYAMFAEFFGDKPLAHFTKRDAARFKELLEDLPANYGKAAEYRGMKAKQIVEMSRSLDVKRLSPRTVQRHFAALSTLWDHAIEHERADTNVFAGWKFAASKRARDQRQMWEKDELRDLFATPVWTGCQSINRRSRSPTRYAATRS